MELAETAQDVVWPILVGFQEAEAQEWDVEVAEVELTQDQVTKRWQKASLHGSRSLRYPCHKRSR